MSRNADAESIAAAADSGARQPTQPWARRLILGLCIAWSVFQLWYASPLALQSGVGINITLARYIHLSFALLLTFLAYPAFGHSPRHRIPVLDIVLGVVAAGSVLYLLVFYRAIVDRIGLPTTADIAAAVVGLVMLLEATRRALGWPLVIVALLFLTYAFGGQYMPDAIVHRGISLEKAANHYWLTSEGVFGVALRVSTTTVFLFVLFGALLERAGAGSYFIRSAFAMLGHLRGGPAKAAVVSSALTGMVSGSSIANVVTTGTFTIPLMKRVGFPATKAGAIEVASSTNGQLTPPIMGAAAFLMVEYVGISYLEVIRHAALPALISYIALVYIVHLEAMKADMQGLPRTRPLTAVSALIGLLSGFLLLAAMSLAIYYGLGWVKTALGGNAPWVIGMVVATVYLGLLVVAAGEDDVDPHAPLEVCPPILPTLRSGLHFLLPVAVLAWCLTVERLSPNASAFYAAAFMVLIVITQRPLLALIRGDGQVLRRAEAGFDDLVAGLIAGARNMIGIGVATAAAGIIVGTVTVTGLGQVMTTFIEVISGGNIILMLIFTAVISLLLGMGLPTTANYIVVSTLMAPVIVSLGSQAGVLIPLVAAHMFVFYFGILADDTPPVGLAAFAASAIAKSDPIKTGIQGFAYDIRTAILPFMFVFNTQLLLIGLTGWADLLVTITSALVAMLVFAAATQGYFVTRSRLWETLALLLVAFTLFRPGFWMDQIIPAMASRPPAEIADIAGALPNAGRLHIRVAGETLEGDTVDRVVALPMGPRADGTARLENAGLELVMADDGTVTIDMVGFASAAEKLGIEFDWQITEVLVPADRPPKELMMIPALALLGLVVALQRRRSRRAAPAAVG